MYRLSILSTVILAILFPVINTRHVRCGPDRLTIDCVDQSTDSSSQDSQMNSTQPEVPQTDDEYTNGNGNGDQDPDTNVGRFGNDATLNFRKRRAVKNIQSSSQEQNEGASGGDSNGNGNGNGSDDNGNGSDVGGSGNDTINFRKRRAIPTVKKSSREDVESGRNGNQNQSSASMESVDSDEIGSGGNETTVSLESVFDVNNTVQEDNVDVLKQKVQQWQNAVDNYLQATYRRRKRQSNWSQLFPSSTSSNTYNNGNTGKGSNSIMATAGNVVGEALKPAMELMTQGVDLLSDLYSTQLTRSMSMSISGTNDTVGADQFRDQLQQLQKKLVDLGDQLQRVVGSFQQMQLPFFDNIFSTGLFSFNLPNVETKSNSKANVMYGIPKIDDK